MLPERKLVATDIKVKPLWIHFFFKCSPICPSGRSQSSSPNVCVCIFVPFLWKLFWVLSVALISHDQFPGLSLVNTPSFPPSLHCFSPFVTVFFTASFHFLSISQFSLFLLKPYFTVFHPFRHFNNFWESQCLRYGGFFTVHFDFKRPMDWVPRW